VRGDEILPLETSADAVLSMYTAMATWCPSCRREIGSLNRLRDAVDTEHVAMFGVPVDPKDSVAMLDEYVQNAAPPYELLKELPLDKRAEFKEFIRRALHTDALPATVIVDQNGTPLYVSPGVPTLSHVRALLD
jgi:thiol-disulfide isomerase/thioredoxin